MLSFYWVWVRVCMSVCLWCMCICVCFECACNFYRCIINDGNNHCVNAKIRCTFSIGLQYFMTLLWVTAYVWAYCTIVQPPAVFYQIEHALLILMYIHISDVKNLIGVTTCYLTIIQDALLNCRLWFLYALPLSLYRSLLLCFITYDLNLLLSPAPISQ